VHAVMAGALGKPLAILNLGGVGNVTWLGRGGEMLAFDTGPANGPLDDWIFRHTGQPWDQGGQVARSGSVDAAVLARLLAHPYLMTPPPKSLDRQDFHAALQAGGIGGLSVADGAATLVQFCAACVAAAEQHMPEKPLQWLVAGGGRHNPAIMQALRSTLSAPVRKADHFGWDGDALEAQAFGILAARVRRNLPLTFPGTTGVTRPLQGGRICEP
jgi:anhydro-N-acetylmuramic acid kinase